MFPADEEHKKLFFIKFNKQTKKYDSNFTMGARVLTDLGNHRGGDEGDSKEIEFEYEATESEHISLKKKGSNFVAKWRYFESSYRGSEKLNFSKYVVDW